MIALEKALPLRNVALDIEAADTPAAVHRAVGLLKSDTRMLDWDLFSEAVARREKECGTSIGGGLLLPHGRGDFVGELVMSFVRLRQPLATAEGPVRFVIAVAIPASMAADYLRLVGALARVFRDQKSKTHLETTLAPRALIEWLGERCR